MNGLLFNDSVGLLKEPQLKVVEPKKGITVQLLLSKSIDKYVVRFQKSRGTTKAMACQMLALLGLQKSGLLDESVKPIGKVISGSGRRSYSENAEIKTVIKLPVKAHKAIVVYRIDNSIDEKLNTLTQRFIMQGLEKEGFLRLSKA